MVLDFLRTHADILQQKICEHVALSCLSLFFAILIAIPLGIGTSRYAPLRQIILPLGSVSQTIPSLAMLGFLIPFFGLGNVPTLIVLTFYAIYPILKGTHIGLNNIPGECLEAAEGLGFSVTQKLWWVELPLAMPTIISGIRVATSMTIGITSIAAFIGAGGLGDFIMQGLSLNNTSLILLGAIPTALLALSFDFAIGRIEQHAQSWKLKSSSFLKFQKRLLVLLGLIVVLGSGSSLYHHMINKNDTIVVASKNFTESFILAEMMAQMIEAKTSLKVIRKFNLGTSHIIHQAMLQKDVDLYPDYTGTAYLTILKKPITLATGNLLPEVARAYKDKFNFIWLKPFGFSNSQAIAIHADQAQRYQIQTLSDLARFSQELTIVAPPDFVKRPDALPGLIQVYGLRFKKIIQIDPNLIYTIIKSHKADLIAAFTTDGKLEKSNLRLLEDDKKFYPSYEAAPIIRQDVLQAYPEIYEALSPLFGGIDQTTMQMLNAQVDREGKSPAEVVRQFLIKFSFI